MPMAQRTPPSGRAASSGSALTEREAFFLGEHRWAVRALMRAEDRNDFAPWVGGGYAHECPGRWRLARCLVLLRELKDKSPLERSLKAETAKIWVKLTRPGWKVAPIAAL